VQGQMGENYAGDRQWQTDCGEVDLPPCWLNGCDGF
jgi:hypothetical protein